MGVKKEKSWGSLPARLWFGSGYMLLLQAALISGGPSLMLTATSSPCALVPVGLIHMDYRSGFSQPLASAWGVTEQHWRTLNRGRERGPGFHSPNNSLPWHCGLTSDTSPKVTPALTFVKEFHLFVLSPDRDTHLIWSSGQLQQLWVWILRFNSLISVLIFASQYHGASQMVQW